MCRTMTGTLLGIESKILDALTTEFQDPDLFDALTGASMSVAFGRSAVVTAFIVTSSTRGIFIPTNSNETRRASEKTS